MNFRKSLFILGSLVMMFGTSVAMAAEGAAASGDAPWSSLGAALALGLAAFGGAIGQGRTATAALEGIARNPNARGQVFVPMIIGLALIESLVIYAFIIAFLKVR